MRFSIGNKIVHQPVKRIDDANNLWGDGWHARCRENGCTLKYQTAGHGTADDEVAISGDEFAALRANPDVFETILCRYKK